MNVSTPAPAARPAPLARTREYETIYVLRSDVDGDSAEKVQARIISEGVTIPLGQYVQPMARRKTVSGNVPSPVTVFWNVEKK